MRTDVALEIELGRRTCDFLEIENSGWWKRMMADKTKKKSTGHQPPISDDEAKPAKPHQVRTGVELEAVVIQTHCNQCWAYPNRQCSVFGSDAKLHLGRYERARKNGFITDEELELAQARKGESNYVTWEEKEN